MVTTRRRAITHEAEFEHGERLQGPLKEQLLLQLAFGELALMDLCAKATQMDVSVLFLGEWDASLSARHTQCQRWQGSWTYRWQWCQNNVIHISSRL